jgi:bifunctional DNA-binding transcriptional regulator/antitoxin component of YhaV-PrlF toxin-antitoxin module
MTVLHALGFREGDMLSATPQLDGNRIVLERIATNA